MAIVATVGLLACSSTSEEPTTPALPSVLRVDGAYTLAATSVPVLDPSPRIHYVVTIANRSGSTEQLQYGGCWTYLRLFDTAERTGAPSFESASLGGACPFNSTRAQLDPGMSIQIAGSYEILALLAAGVAPGHYYVSLLMAPNGAVTSVPAGEIDLQP